MGRDGELRALRSLIDAARSGTSGVLLVRGAAGAGKSALLDAAVQGLDGVRLLRVDGLENQTALPFAALQRLIRPLGPALLRLPARHADALRVAVGVQDGPPPNHLLVGLALLALLARAARDRPVVVVVDDAHWLDADTRGVVALVARRLRAEPVALVLALDDEPATRAYLPEVGALQLTGLGVDDAASLLAARTGRRVEPRNAARIVSVTGGIPLALIDLAADLDLGGPTDVSWWGEPVPIRRRLETHYLQQVLALPERSQRWLLVVAASSTGRIDLIRSTSRRLGCRGDDARPALGAGLVLVRGQVHLRHPLVRSAVCSAATADERRRVHMAWAVTAVRSGLVDVAAWHSAQAASGVDERAAHQLEVAAGRAVRCGAVATASVLLARAADLTTPGPEHAERLLLAAEAAGAAGDDGWVSDLLGRMRTDELGPSARGRMIVSRSALAVDGADPVAFRGAAAELVRASDLFHDTEPEREQETLLRAFEAYQSTGWLMGGITPPDLGRRIRLAARVAPGPTSVVLEALAALILDPYPLAVPRLRAALDAVEHQGDAGAMRFGLVASTLAGALGDPHAGTACLVRAVRCARELGGLRPLAALLQRLACAEVERGDPASGEAYAIRSAELRQTLGDDPGRAVDPGVLAWTGAPRARVEAVAEAVLGAGLASVHTVAMTALAARDIADDRHRDAYDALVPLVARRQVNVIQHQLPELVEAAARSGHLGDAESATLELEAIARECGTPWSRGVGARCRALISPADQAEVHYRAAVGLLSVSGTPVDLARAHLLYGEWLRRARRRGDARIHLRAALTIFAGVRAAAFAARAERELESTGRGSSRRLATVGVDELLTSRERAVARMAAAGSTNAEIGDELFVSATSVDHDLRAVFQKLGVRSRRRLAATLAATRPVVMHDS